ncbi:hypothetical protein K2173_000447 [Erythroxylum novogranatense]|uniref:FAD-binding PCMH-type domain-containing protein n=1 Tax=Erythroxylum novogranatense TaxID=1862640 RepID=A0AAV8SWA3_9ROSI|nr:hypothetical protein K2173_000447 [Erythroxylum novogranatense]
MKPILVFLISLLILSSSSCEGRATSPIHEKFIQCMSTQFTNATEIMLTPDSPLYSSLFKSTQQNMRWLNSSILNPPLIFTPFHQSQIQAAIFCSKKLTLQVRVRSGGHDYEGQSYMCMTPFIIIDFMNLHAIEIDINKETAWVQSGATLGQLYHAIGKISLVHGFPAGICPTVGIGGHFSGGGFGTLLRKHGLAADNVMDAYFIGANGKIMDRKGMGEDIFWAIRGGGGASFGVIVSWKIKLVRVPQVVTVFTISKTLEQGATKLVHKWQHIADKLHEDLFIRIIIQKVGGQNSTNPKTVQASFNSVFLGQFNKLLPLMNGKFPELGLKAEDCTEMGWVDSAIYFAGYPKGSPWQVLLDKTQLYKASFKAKSDFVTQPIPERALEGLWKRILQEEIAIILFDPFGGRMSEISEADVPFPHRKGNLYNIQYMVKWDVNDVSSSDRHIKWIGMLYQYMAPYVSKYPRAAYLNYKDLDLGTIKHDNAVSPKAAGWGFKYFKSNFKRLIQVKSKVDPENFFRDEQSIPCQLASRKL